MTDNSAAVIVYQARNLVDGCRYIGFTTKGLEVRRAQHLKSARVKQSRFRFQHAINKYGPENFVFEVLGDFDGDEELAKLYEIEAIAKYKPEYNLSYGGDGGSLSEETRAKISASRIGLPGTWLGKKFSDEHRANMRASFKGRPHPGARGKKRDPAVVARIRETIKGHPNYYKGKAVTCLTDGQTFDSTQAAASFYSLSYGSVTAILKGRKTSVKGLSFAYYEAPK